MRALGFGCFEPSFHLERELKLVYHPSDRLPLVLEIVLEAIGIHYFVLFWA